MRKAEGRRSPYSSARGRIDMNRLPNYGISRRPIATADAGVSGHKEGAGEIPWQQQSQKSSVLRKMSSVTGRGEGPRGRQSRPVAPARTRAVRVNSSRACLGDCPVKYSKARFSLVAYARSCGVTLESTHCIVDDGYITWASLPICLDASNGT